MDQFKKLPEPLIVDILSLLELNEAVKTAILAKRWKNLWSKVHNIVLKRMSGSINHEELSVLQMLEINRLSDKDWESSVDRTLMQCTTVNINRFCLVVFSSISDGLADKWISYALDRNVKILELTHFRGVPERLFKTSSIMALKLCHIMDLSLPSEVNLSSLKSLHLDSPSLDDASFDKLLMGCPVLEDVALGSVYERNHITIMSPSVKKFKLYWFENEDEIDFLNIKAPWLHELEISEKFVTTECQLVDVSSLTKATLTIHNMIRPLDMFDTEEEFIEYNDDVTQHNYRWIPMVTKLMNSLSYVGELTIGSQPIQVLALDKVQGVPSPLFKCKHLSIETYLWRFDLPGIACLLENAPHVETLLIKVLPFWQDMYPLSQIEELFTNEDPHLNIPSGKLVNLKSIRINYSRYSCHDSAESNRGECFDFELVDYLLRSVVTVEKLVLCSSNDRCHYDTCPMRSCTFQYVPRLSSKLTAKFLNGNESAAEWELKRSKNKFVFTFSKYASLHPTTDASTSSN